MPLGYALLIASRNRSISRIEWHSFIRHVCNKKYINQREKALSENCWYYMITLNRLVCFFLFRVLFLPSLNGTPSCIFHSNTNSLTSPLFFSSKLDFVECNEQFYMSEKLYSQKINAWVENNGVSEWCEKDALCTGDDETQFTITRGALWQWCSSSIWTIYGKLCNIHVYVCSCQCSPPPTSYYVFSSNNILSFWHKIECFNGYWKHFKIGCKAIFWLLLLLLLLW